MITKIYPSILSVILMTTFSFSAYANLDTLPVEPINTERLTEDELAKTVDQAIFNAVTKNLTKDVVNNIPKPVSTSQYQIDPSMYPEKNIVKTVSGDAQTPNVIGKPQVAGRNQLTDTLRKKYKSTQMIKLKPEKSELVPVAVGLQNRISTSFDTVQIKTSDLNTPIEVSEGSYIYVTPKSTSPISLMIGEKGVPESMVNLTLMPLDVPPVMINLEVELSKKLKIRQREVIAQRASKSEHQRYIDDLSLKPVVENDPRTSSEHAKRVSDLLTLVALGDTPAGFTLSESVPVAQKHPCDINKMMMYHEVGQQLVSSREIIDVVLVQNDINGLREVREEYCFADDVIAAAVYDKAILAQNETTEMYILRDKLHKEKTRKVRKRARLTERK